MTKLYTSYTKDGRSGRKRAPAPEPLGCGIALLFWGALLWVLQDEAAIELLKQVRDWLEQLLP